MDRNELFILQDDVLIGLTTLPPKINRDALYALPPWRAVMFARLAHMAGVLERKERDNIIREARITGGDGWLKPYTQRTERELAYGVHSPWTPPKENEDG